MMTVLVLILAYLLGSVPFGLLLTRLAGLGDIRTIGSGNIGATNVLRTGKKLLALSTLLLDGLKGTLAVLLAAWLAPNAMPFAALLALAGHMFPVWLKFKGGKGVATLFGIWLALSPAVFVGMALCWLASFAYTRISSVGALAAMAALPLLTHFMAHQFLPVAFIGAALVVYKHLPNIYRLLQGAEPRFDKKADSAGDAA